MQKYTRILYFLSLALSLTSLYVLEKGGKEIYPFFSWKLFTNPSGSENFEEQYRIYTVKGKDTVRIPCQRTAIYDENNVALIIGFYGRKIDKNEDREANIRKLNTFMKSYKPIDRPLILFKESYKPWDLGKPAFTIQKTFVSTL